MPSAKCGNPCSLKQFGANASRETAMGPPPKSTNGTSGPSGTAPARNTNVFHCLFNLCRDGIILTSKNNMVSEFSTNHSHNTPSVLALLTATGHSLPMPEILRRPTNPADQLPVTPKASRTPKKTRHLKGQMMSLEEPELPFFISFVLNESKKIIFSVER